MWIRKNEIFFLLTLDLIKSKFHVIHEKCDFIQISYLMKTQIHEQQIKYKLYLKT